MAVVGLENTNSEVCTILRASTDTIMRVRRERDHSGIEEIGWIELGANGGAGLRRTTERW